MKKRFILSLSKGFTLIELLVVIAIIGILATLIITNIQGVRERGRDLRRKSDLSSIQKSLRLYYNDNKVYPDSSVAYQIVGCGTTASTITCSWGSSFAKNSTTYMSRLPLDPLSSPTNVISYSYYLDPADSDQYIIVSTLENQSDSDIAASQAQCSSIYTAYAAASGQGDATKDYVLCTD